MDDEAQVLWPEHESLYELMCLKATICNAAFANESRATGGAFDDTVGGITAAARNVISSRTYRSPWLECWNRSGRLPS